MDDTKEEMEMDTGQQVPSFKETSTRLNEGSSKAAGLGPCYDTSCIPDLAAFFFFF